MTARGGAEAVELDLSGLRVRVAGLPTTLAAALRGAWRDFPPPPPPAGGAREAWLSIVLDEPLPDEPPAAAYRPKAMQASLGAESARYRLPEGELVIERGQAARVRLARDLPERRDYFTLLNLLRAAIAWRLPDRGGAMLHAAGLVLDERAVLLVGSEGSGKSTWARAGERAGAHVISDDVVLVDGAAAGFEVLGAPLRSDHRGPQRPGRWPLAALLFAEHGAPPRLRPASRLLTRARLASNLPFLAEGLESDPRVAAVLERLVARAPAAELRFAPDPSFIAPLVAWLDGLPRD